ncbi:transposase [Desulfurivibrio sp. C05AmB]|uniref:transposase n=1 Tax=Desulfurivibrio sp. C05AmB TaxID=3374371 RepID=UPI00376EFF9D
MACKPQLSLADALAVPAYPKNRGHLCELVLRYLGRYVHRIALTNNRILTCDHDQVTFSYRQSRRKGHDRWRTMPLPATQFMARFLQHVPPRGFHKVRYYGWYSNRGRGDRVNRQADAASAAQSPPPAEVEVLDVSDYRPRKIPSPTWRECIKKVWEVDPLACPKCAGEMKIISFLSARRLATVRWSYRFGGCRRLEYRDIRESGAGSSD